MHPSIREFIHSSVHTSVHWWMHPSFGAHIHPLVVHAWVHVWSIHPCIPPSMQTDNHYSGIAHCVWATEQGVVPVISYFKVTITKRNGRSLWKRTVYVSSASEWFLSFIAGKTTWWRVSASVHRRLKGHVRPRNKVCGRTSSRVAFKPRPCNLVPPADPSTTSWRPSVHVSLWGTFRSKPVVIQVSHQGPQTQPRGKFVLSPQLQLSGPRTVFKDAWGWWGKRITFRLKVRGQRKFPDVEVSRRNAG